MTVKGKITASALRVGDRIIVVSGTYTAETAAAWGESVQEGGSYFHESRTKLGEGVQVVRVIGKTFRAASGRYERQGKFVIETTAGTFEAAGCQTMWLAPEDAAGIKRAHVEALADDLLHLLIETEAAEEERIEAYLSDELTLHSQSGKVDNMTETSTEIDTLIAEHGTDWSEPGAADKLIAEIETQPGDLVQGYPLSDGRPGAVIQVDKVIPGSSEMGDTVVGHPVATREATGSSVVQLLEKVWDRIRQNHPDLPKVVFVTGSGLVGASKWGHFRANGWKGRDGSSPDRHEMMIAGETMAKGAKQLLQTMLHEGAHTLAKVRGKQDTSRQGRWHNQTFRKMAEEMGLEHRAQSADSAHGYSFVTPTDATLAAYADLLADLDREIHLVCHLPGWMGGTDEEDQGGEKITGKPKGDEKSSGNLKATCQCEEPIIIRLSRKVLDLAVVKCDACGELFTTAER